MYIARIVVTVSIGMDLLLCAIDPTSGEARFGPRLSYALPVAEMVCLTQAGRVALRDDHLVIIRAAPVGEPMTDAALTDLQQLPATYPPLTMQGWVSWRGPRRIDVYLKAAADLGIVKIVKAEHPGQTLAVVNPEPINQATRRLVAVLDDSTPNFEDVAFAVLADSAGVARPHLQSWEHHRDRVRLSSLRHSDGDSDAAQVLREGCKAITELSRLATADPRTIDQQIGLTPEVRRAGETTFL